MYKSIKLYKKYNTAYINKRNDLFKKYTGGKTLILK